MDKISEAAANLRGMVAGFGGREKLQRRVAAFKSLAGLEDGKKRRAAHLHRMLIGGESEELFAYVLIGMAAASQACAAEDTEKH